MNAVKAVLILLIALSFHITMTVGSFAAVPDDASTYYPLVTGNSWTYQFADNKSTVRYEVVGFLEGHNTYLVSCLTKMIDVNIQTEEVMANRAGRIIHIGGTDIRSGKSRRMYENGEVILDTPLKAGATWEYDKDNRDNELACRVKCRVVKFTDCEVKAGRFENVCMIQRTTCYYENNVEKYRKVQNEYYAPGVGEIKEESVDALGNANVLMELLEYKIK